MKELLKAVQDHLQREADIPKAQSALRDLASRRIPRDRLARAAYLARRAMMPELSLRLLYKAVCGRRARPSEEERGEYGMALAEIGAAHEAISLLSRLDVKRHPWIFRGLTLAYFRQWEWAKARPMIERFLDAPKLSVADRLWGNYFLGRSLLHGAEDPVAAARVFAELADASDRHGFADLAYDARFALADSHYLRREWAQAHAILDRLEAGWKSSPDAAAALTHIEQLRSEARLWETQGGKAALRRLRAVRERFVALGRWERVRECDYQEALATRNEELLLRLYFGTPYPGARRKFLRDLAVPADRLPGHFDWRIGPAGARGAGELDVRSGQNSFGSARLKAGQVQQRALETLARDFYAPTRKVTLHERLFPRQYFNAVSSPFRTSQAIYRLRLWLQDSGIPPLVSESGSAYFLESERAVDLRVPRPEDDSSVDEGAREAAPRLAALLASARSRYGGSEFTAEQFARGSDLSERSTRRYLSTAAAAGAIEVRGRGPATRYRFR